MRRLTLLIFFVLTIMISVGCCSHATYTPSVDLLQHQTNATVALVYRIPSGHYSAYCGATWINNNQMITAAHCVDSRSPGETVKYQMYKDYDANHPKSKNKKAYLAKVVVVSKTENVDLAVLETISDVSHSYANIASYDAQSGMVVHIMGHPLGFQFTPIMGIVAQERIFDALGAKRHVYHVTGLVAPGNSGGSAMDEHGNVLGVMSLLRLDFDGHGFFVHNQQIRKFLKKNKVAHSLSN